MSKKIKAFYTKNDKVIVATHIDENEEMLEDVLQYYILPAGISANGAGIQFMTILTAFGFPVNKYPVNVLKDSLGIVFEIELDEDDRYKLENNYKDTLSSMKHPDIKILKPKSKLIV